MQRMMAVAMSAAVLALVFIPVSTPADERSQAEPQMQRPGWQIGPGSGDHMMGPGYGPGMMGTGNGRHGRFHGSGGVPIDTNDDGVVSAAEAARHFEAAFVTLDADDDGNLSAQEFTSTQFGPGPHMTWHGGITRNWRQNKEARFEAMDANSDGMVSQADFIAYGKSRYEAADGDRDGKVTVWEFRAQRRF